MSWIWKGIQRIRYLHCYVISQNFSIRSNLRNVFIENAIDSEILESCRRLLLLLSFSHPFTYTLQEYVIVWYNCRFLFSLSYTRVPLCVSYTLPSLCNILQFDSHLYTYIKVHRALWSDARLSRIQKTFISHCYTCKISSYFSIEIKLTSAYKDIYIHLFIPFLFSNRYFIYFGFYIN